MIHQSQVLVRFYPRASWACERHNASLDCRAWRGSSPNTNTWDANTMQRLCVHHPHHLNHHHHHWRSQVVKEGTRVSFHTGTEQEQGTGRGMILVVVTIISRLYLFCISKLWFDFQISILTSFITC